MAYGGVRRRPRAELAWGAGFVLGVALAGCKGESTESDDDESPGTGGTHGAGTGGTNGAGTGGTNGFPSGTPVSSDTFAQRFAASFCEAIGPCCTRGGFAYTQSSCTAAAQAFLQAAIGKSLSAPGISYNESAAGDCIAAYAAAARACTEPAILDGDDSPCRHIFKGTIAEGGHCTEDGECVQRDDAYVKCNAGVCTSMPNDFVVIGSAHAQLGEACGASCSRDGHGTGCLYVAAPASNKGCWEEDGLFCNAAAVCAPVPKLGEACPSQACATDTYCSGGICVASTATGPCPSYDGCLHTSYCDSDTQMCVPLKANGAACNYDSECLSYDCEGDVCRRWSVANASTCAGLLDD